MVTKINGDTFGLRPFLYVCRCFPNDLRKEFSNKLSTAVSRWRRRNIGVVHPLLNTRKKSLSSVVADDNRINPLFLIGLFEHVRSVWAVMGFQKAAFCIGNIAIDAGRVGVIGLYVIPVNPMTLLVKSVLNVLERLLRILQTTFTTYLYPNSRNNLLNVCRYLRFQNRRTIISNWSKAVCRV